MQLIPWLGLMFPLAFSAGPNNVMCAAVGSAFGLKKTIPMILGINTVIAAYSILAGAGLGELFVTYPFLIRYFRYAGGIYILWLAYGFLKAGTLSGKDFPVNPPTFLTGVIVSALNPKLVIALLLMYSRFMDTNAGIFSQVVILTLAVVILSASAHFTWTTVGTALTALLNTDRLQRIQNFLFGGMLVIVGVWMFF